MCLPLASWLMVFVIKIRPGLLNVIGQTYLSAPPIGLK